ncbi:MAG: hypothetical protein KatS3mg108_1055 [Isosphaeraceae bacterium]|jgi:DNA-directed RNA polymerase specialized sigma24 family protein|nr:MAG: hypothetical protein KatS3mg108_1055 [Isosphaeraceae bacterium]
MSVTLSGPVIWFVAGLAVLPWVVAGVIGLALLRLSDRLRQTELALTQLRRQHSDRPRAPLADPAPDANSAEPAVPRGPRAAGLASKGRSPVCPLSSTALPESTASNPIPVSTLIAVPNLDARSPNEADHPLAAEIAAFEERFAEILHLADAGLPCVEVARLSGLPAGQVELILGLARRVRQPPTPRPA